MIDHLTQPLDLSISALSFGMDGWQVLSSAKLQGWLLRAVPTEDDGLLSALSDGTVLYSERLSGRQLQKRAARLNPDLDLDPGVLRRLLRNHALPPQEVWG